MSEYILEMNHITKEFSGVKALDDVNLKVRKGEIMAICGENGAGKSTQIESNLDEIFNQAKEILKGDDDRDICNFWNQRIQYLFNKKIALQFLEWAIDGSLPPSFTRAECEALCAPLVSILSNETELSSRLAGDVLYIAEKSYRIVPAIILGGANTISDFEIARSLPSVVERLINS